MGEIQKADPRARLHSLLLLALATVLGAALILVVKRQGGTLIHWLMRDLAKATLRINVFFALAVICLIGPVFAFSFYIWRFGGRVAAAGRFPPPGFAVVRDTPVSEGPSAVRRGRLLQVCAGLLAFLACAILALFWVIVSRLSWSGS